MTLPLYKDEEPATAEVSASSNEKTAEIQPSGTSMQNEILVSPLTGNVIELSNVPDEVFSSGVMGKGIAVDPTVGKVFASADAEVTTLFPTGHAIGLKTPKGTEILIHIGMDTVKLNGEGFKTHIAQGDKVKKGQLLIEFDINFIKKNNLPVITPVLVTNSAEYKEIVPTNSPTVKNGDNLISTVV